MVLNEKDKKFLEEKKQQIYASGAIVLFEEEKVKKLSKEIAETNKRLRFFL